MPISLVTCNMQGGGGADTSKNSLLDNWMQAGVNVICLQEATNPLGRFEFSRNDGEIGLYKSPPPLRSGLREQNQYTCYYYQFGSGNSRCSLATYVLNGSTTSGDFGIIITPPDPTTGNERRPLIWVKIPISTPIPSSLYIGNVHLTSGDPATAKSQFDNFKIGMSSKVPYVIAGDFNMPLPYIQANFPDHINFRHPPVATHQSGNILDYVYSIETVPIGYSTGYPSDHRYLSCTLG